MNELLNTAKKNTFVKRNNSMYFNEIINRQYVISKLSLRVLKNNIFPFAWPTFFCNKFYWNTTGKLWISLIEYELYCKKIQTTQKAWKKFLKKSYLINISANARATKQYQI